MREFTPCPLCRSENPEAMAVSDALYYHCLGCDLRFLDPKARLAPEAERDRYLQHENDASNLGYRNFLEPMFHTLKSKLTAGSRGLDYGCGTGSPLKEIFAEGGFELVEYDPFFAPDPARLSGRYDFITATEVAEHFFDPGSEFRKLRELLKPGGHLGLMTLLVPRDFENWYYRRDPTHVVFYSPRTFEWIAAQVGFDQLYCDQQRIVTLRRTL